jgi:Kef-type K+ transport system membrane component KefB
MSVVYTLLFSLVFSVLTYVGEQLNWYNVPSYAVVIILYMTFVTSSVLIIIQKQNNHRVFSQAYLASIVFKILTGLCLILVLMRLDPQGAGGNAGLFIVSYLAFTAVEVACLLKGLGMSRN